LALNFGGNDITQYGISKGSPQALESITACFWMSAPEAYLKGHEASLLSYAAQGSSYGNEFLLSLEPHFHLWIQNNRYRYDVELLFPYICY
jgi:hypothetical protein